MERREGREGGRKEGRDKGEMIYENQRMKE